MKAVLIFLIAVALVLTAQMRESRYADPINPTDELIDRELIQQAAPEQE